MKATFCLQLVGLIYAIQSVDIYFGVVERAAPCKSGHYHFRLPLDDVDGV